MFLRDNELKKKKSLFLRLKSLYGINNNTAYKLCALAGITPSTKLNKITKSHFDKLKRIFYTNIKYDLFERKIANIRYLINIKHYRGLRLKNGLPVRGQRTKTNASTCKKFRFFNQINN